MSPRGPAVIDKEPLSGGRGQGGARDGPGRARTGPGQGQGGRSAARSAAAVGGGIVNPGAEGERGRHLSPRTGRAALGGRSRVAGMGVLHGGLPSPCAHAKVATVRRRRLGRPL